MNAVYGWHTKKTEGGFKWRVYKLDVTTKAMETLKDGVCPTRAKAIGNAKNWVRYYRRGGK